MHKLVSKSEQTPNALLTASREPGKHREHGIICLCTSHALDQVRVQMTMKHGESWLLYRRELLHPVWMLRLIHTAFSRPCCAMPANRKLLKPCKPACSKAALCAGDVVTRVEAGHVLRIVPERRGHRLGIQWSVPPEQRDTWRSRPCGLLSHLLGCEGKK